MGTNAEVTDHILLAYRVTLPTLGLEPVLSIERSNTMVRISWPSAYSNFLLQSTATLTPPAWTVLASNLSTFSTVATNSARFFRLASP